VRFYVGITDRDWFDYVSDIHGVDEVNFWQPSGNQQFRSLQPGEPFLFKLHSPEDYIVGGGFFSHFTILPASFAWKAFGTKNGAATEEEIGAPA
jgi:putative restriction endonuclease